EHQAASRPARKTSAHKKAPSGKGVPAHSEAPSPWSKRAEPARPGHAGHAGRAEAAGRPDVPEVIPIGVLHEVCEECSQTERRADEAERELMEWKKLKFMRDRVGEE